ncbi:MAG: hypothetical protein JKY56_17195 [Kofleriaceae bacterium]|nr:hypothetical protein [Kofleriaceae bacterium]
MHLLAKSLRFLPSFAFLGLAAIACNEPPVPTDGELEGRVLGLTLGEQIPESLRTTSPYRCARPKSTPGRVPSFANTGTSLVDGILELDRSVEGPLHVAFVGDSRGAHAHTITQTTQLLTALSSENLELLVSVGGLGTNLHDIKSILSVLSSDKRVPLIAYPGDRESVGDHRQAIDELAKDGRTVIDGSSFPLIAMGPLLLAGLPGIPYSSNLVSGDEGCIYTLDDANQLIASIPDSDRKVILTTYAPLAGLPTELGQSGIPVGVKVASAQSSDPPIWAVIHGLTRSPKLLAQGAITAKSPQQAIIAGSLDPSEGTSDALILSISRKRIDWRRFRSP